MSALFCEQVSDSRIRPTGGLFVDYFLGLVSALFLRESEQIVEAGWISDGII
jgi:hypothetical protein